MTDVINKSLALLFDPDQVIWVSAIRLNDTMSKRFFTDLDKAAAVIKRHPEDWEL